MGYSRVDVLLNKTFYFFCGTQEEEPGVLGPGYGGVTLPSCRPGIYRD